MCRHVAWSGRPRTLASLLVDPEFGLMRQSWAPRRQRYGTVNADGFGVGWYAPDVRSRPARYRRAVPMWTDASFASFAGAVVSSQVLAAVRSASVGMPIEETATAPFTSGTVLLSHNGRVSLDAASDLLAAEPPGDLPESRCDAAIVAAVVFRRLASGLDLPDAIGGTVRDLGAADPAARLNLLATDGDQIVATTWGETLGYRVSPDGVEVASEPPDAEAKGWVDVADHQILLVHHQDVTIRDLS